MGFAALYHPKESFCGILMERIHRDLDVSVDPCDLAQQVGADRRIERRMVRSAVKSVGEDTRGAGLPKVHCGVRERINDRQELLRTRLRIVYLLNCLLSQFKNEDKLPFVFLMRENKNSFVQMFDECVEVRVRFQDDIQVPELRRCGHFHPCLSRSFCDVTAAGICSLRCAPQFSNLSVVGSHVKRVLRINGWLLIHDDIG